MATQLILALCNTAYQITVLLTRFTLIHHQKNGGLHYNRAFS